MAELFRTGTDLGCGHLSRFSGRTGIREEVKTLALDDYPLERVDFIKIDVEGGEIAALAGARRLLERSRPVMQIEYNPWCVESYTGNSRRALYDVLVEMYPHIQIIGKHNGKIETVSCWDELDRELTAHTYCDLLCTH